MTTVQFQQLTSFLSGSAWPVGTPERAASGDAEQTAAAATRLRRGNLHNDDGDDDHRKRPRSETTQSSKADDGKLAPTRGWDGNNTPHSCSSSSSSTAPRAAPPAASRAGGGGGGGAGGRPPPIGRCWAWGGGRPGRGGFGALRTGLKGCGCKGRRPGFGDAPVLYSGFPFSNSLPFPSFLPCLPFSLSPAVLLLLRPAGRARLS